MTVEDFQAELLSEAQALAQVELTTFDESMGHVLCQLVEELEIATDIQEFHARAQGRRGRRLAVAAVGEDSVDNSLFIVVTRTFADSETQLGKRDFEHLAEGVAQFVEMATANELQENLEESSTAFHLAEYLRDRSRNVSRYRAVIVTNGQATSSVKGLVLPKRDVGEASMSFEVFDAARLAERSSSQSGRDPIYIELGEDGSGVPCVFGGETPDGIRTYLFTLNGRHLADIYDEYGSRILQSNVRSFLSIRGNVNKGIQSTLDREPDMFLPFNNGLTTTATEADIKRTEGGFTLRSLTDWQIVNGGQTTASMWYFRNRYRNRNAHKLLNLERATVQVKLVVVQPDRAEEIVPDIAKFANSQNKVSLSDFSSNSPFQKRLEQLSEKVLAPAVHSNYDTKWFYERTRGSYDNAKSKRLGKRQKEFMLRYPKSQKFDKIDVARAANVWSYEPHTVSKGAQTSFSLFSDRIGDSFTSNPEYYNERFFKDLISQIIVLRETRKHVMTSSWYGKGYLANIIAYGVSKLLYDFSDMFPEHELDLARIWSQQGLDEYFTENLEVACQGAQDHLTDPDRPQGNVTQWAKQASCWESFRDSPLEYYETVEDLVSHVSKRTEEAQEALAEQRTESAFRGYIELHEVPLETWKELQEFFQELGGATETDMSIISVMIHKRIVSEKQALVLSRALKRAEDAGFRV